MISSYQQQIKKRNSNVSGVSEMETYFCPIIPELFRQGKILFNSLFLTFGCRLLIDIKHDSMLNIILSEQKLQVQCQMTFPDIKQQYRLVEKHILLINTPCWRLIGINKTIAEVTLCKSEYLYFWTVIPWLFLWVRGTCHIIT